MTANTSRSLFLFNLMLKLPLMPVLNYYYLL